MKNALGISALAGFTLLAGQIANAAVPIAKQSGFSGFVDLGAGNLTYQSNMIAGTSLFTVGSRTVHSLTDEPKTDSKAIPAVAFTARYTLADSRTEFFLGNSLEDFLRFDFGAKLGARREFGALGTLGAAFLFTASPTEVWEDPYLLNQNRGKSDRKSQGLSLKWESILSSNFDIEFKGRKIDVDKERSGQSLAGLTPAQRELLKRDGDQYSVQLDYFWKLGERHRLVPSFVYTDFDLDGDAMANESYDALLTYLYFGSKFNVILNGSFGKNDYDKRNPIFNKTREEDTYGLSARVSYKQPFGLKDWNAFVSGAWYLEDSNIDFYQTELAVVTVGGHYTF